MLRYLSTLAHKLPQDVDRLLQDLANHPSWLVLTSNPAGDELEPRDSRSTQAVHLLSALATIHATAQAETVVCEFCSYAIPILDALTNVQHPAVTHHIVQLADVLCPYEPRAALLTAQKAVTGDRGYAREALGLDATLSLTRRYLTDHRDLLRTDALCLTAIRALLEVFVRVGWDQALRLSEDLDELFR